jgi:CelD/BcsL family acetyltransferase involved in cellulose biosynthesis
MAGDQAGAAEYLDWIVREDLEEPVYGAIAAVLAAQAPPWDFIWMPYVATWKGTGTKVLEACRRHGLTTRERPQAFAVVDLPAEYSRYLASLSGNARSAVKRQTREFAERGLTFEECRSGEQLPEYLERLFALNHLRWRERGHRGIVEKPALMRFFRQFAPVALARGWLRLFAARLGREIMAIQYGYVYGGAFHQVTEGFDPRVASGVGTALRARVIETCIKEGLSAYDFLAGYTDHKRRWGAAMRFGSDLLIGNRRSRGALCAGVGIWPTGRYLRASTLPR